jgi:hypothetical protein
MNTLLIEREAVAEPRLSTDGPLITDHAWMISRSYIKRMAEELKWILGQLGSSEPSTVMADWTETDWRSMVLLDLLKDNREHIIDFDLEELKIAPDLIDRVRNSPLIGYSV